MTAGNGRGKPQLDDRQLLWHLAAAAEIVGQLEAAGLLCQVLDMIPEGTQAANGFGRAAEIGQEILAELRGPVGSYFPSAYNVRDRNAGKGKRNGKAAF
jgi:hypothetical protein